MRLGKAKSENFVFIFPLRSALIFFGFAQDRMRLGKAKSENFVFSLGFALGFHYLYPSTLSPFPKGGRGVFSCIGKHKTT